MTGQVLGLQCKLLVGDGASPEVFGNVGHLRNFQGPQFSSERVEVTDGDSTAREYLAGLQSPGSLPFTMYLEPGLASHTQLLTDVQTTPQPVKNYHLQPTSSAAIYFGGAAFVEQLNFSGGAVNEIVQIDGQLALTGAWTFTTS